MKTEVEFCTSENVVIAIEKIHIRRINLDNILYINFYTNDEKIHSFYRIESFLCMYEPILCRDREILKIVVETKNDEKIEIKIFGSSLFIFNNVVE